MPKVVDDVGGVQGDSVDDVDDVQGDSVDDVDGRGVEEAGRRPTERGAVRKG